MVASPSDLPGIGNESGLPLPSPTLMTDAVTPARSDAIGSRSAQIDVSNGKPWTHFSDHRLFFRGLVSFRVFQCL